MLSGVKACMRSKCPNFGSHKGDTIADNFIASRLDFFVQQTGIDFAGNCGKSK